MALNYSQGNKAMKNRKVTLNSEIRGVHNLPSNVGHEVKKKYSDTLNLTPKIAATLIKGMKR